MARRSVDNYEILITEGQLRQRIADLGGQVSRDFQGRVVHCVGVLENGFVFVADLVRSITCDVQCQFVKPYIREVYPQSITTTEIFYAPEVQIEGEHVLLCEGIVSTGQTTDFLVRNFQARGAASVAICCLLDRQSNRRVSLNVTYSGFQVENHWLAGFGLGRPILDRNLPFICVVPEPRA
jgi:hypoxanthine phosphoribosyltransferase